MPKTYDRVSVVDHPLVKHKLALLRDKNTPPSQFRQIVRELAMLESYEASRDLPTKPVTVETPLQTTECEMLDISPVIVPILRAGLGLLEGIIDIVPSAVVGVIGLERDEVTHKPREYFAKMPPEMEKQHVIIVDPMLATGSSAIAAIKYMREQGVKHLVLMVLVAAPEGIEAVLDADDRVFVVTCAIDEGLNDDAYILPGLGDAGDRIFGTLK